MIPRIDKLVPLAEVHDGEDAWAQFVGSVTDTIEGNQALLPVLGLVVLAGLILLADWKLAKWIERALRRWRSGHKHDQA